jgi:hypothetical protein
VDDEIAAEVEYVRDLRDQVRAQTDDGKDQLLELMLIAAYPARKSQDC